MMHFSRKVWSDYILGNVPEEKRKEYEAHLYACPVCLDTYTDCLDELADRLPGLADEQAFGDHVMFAVECAKSENNIERRSGKERKPYRWRNTSIFHYAVASVITVILTFSGAFHLFSAEIHDVAQKTLEERHTPYSQQLIDKTARWLDQLDRNGGSAN